MSFLKNRFWSWNIEMMRLWDVHILMMSSADILMVSKLPVWVLSSRDLGARCPTFSVPTHMFPVCHVQSSFSPATCAAANIYMCGVCTCLSSAELSSQWAEKSSIMRQSDTRTLSLSDSSQTSRQTFDCKNELAQNKTYFCNMSVSFCLAR